MTKSFHIDEIPSFNFFFLYLCGTWYETIALECTLIRNFRRTFLKKQSEYSSYFSITVTSELLVSFSSVKCKEVKSLTEQLEEKKKNYRKRDNECDQKNIDTQHQLKKAKKAAFVAKGNLIKKERELDYLNSVIQLNQGKHSEKHY